MLRNQCANLPDRDAAKLVDMLLNWSGGELSGLLIARSDPAASHPVSHRVQALYTLCNIAGAGANPLLLPFSHYLNSTFAGNLGPPGGERRDPPAVVSDPLVWWRLGRA